MAPLVELEFDEQGKLRPFTAEESMSIFETWAKNYPSARFVVVVLDPDGADGEDIGWGIALPDHVFVNLPAIGITGRFRTAAALLDILRLSMDARIIWVDPEPEYWPDDEVST